MRKGEEFLIRPSAVSPARTGGDVFRWAAGKSLQNKKSDATKMLAPVEGRYEKPRAVDGKSIGMGAGWDQKKRKINRRAKNRSQKTQCSQKKKSKRKVKFFFLNHTFRYWSCRDKSREGGGWTRRKGKRAEEGGGKPLYRVGGR